MAITPKRLGQAQLGTGNTTIYTAPGATTGVIRSITICNTTAAVRVFSLYLVPSGGSPGDATAIFRNYSVSPNDTLQDDGVHVLLTGGTVVGVADAATSITVTVDGAEVT